MNIDFGLGSTTEKQEPNEGQVIDVDIKPLDGSNDDDSLNNQSDDNPQDPLDNNGDNNDDNQNDDDQSQSNNDDDNQNSELSEGDKIEYNNAEYTVDSNGNLVDNDGNIFKEAKDVKAWIESLEEDDNNISIGKIQELFNIEITDENDQPMEFENSPQGILSYVNSIIDLTREEIVNDTLQGLYNQYPIVEEVLNYYVTNGNSLEGFNEVRDRTSITLDASDEEQQVNIIKTSWKENNRKGDIKSYIDYVKNSGTLYDVAKEELEALKQKDKEYKEGLAAEAKRVKEEEVAATKHYWDSVKNVINKGVIANYKIPETIIVNDNGTKIAKSRDDFFNYLYVTDKDGKTGYMKDVESESEEKRLNDQLLTAFIKFNKGSYNSLAEMAVADKQIKKLKDINSKQRKTINIVKSNNKSTSSKMDLGY